MLHIKLRNIRQRNWRKLDILVIKVQEVKGGDMCINKKSGIDENNGLSFFISVKLQIVRSYHSVLVSVTKQTYQEELNFNQQRHRSIS